LRRDEGGSGGKAGQVGGDWESSGEACARRGLGKRARDGQARDGLLYGEGGPRVWSSESEGANEAA
jgi:hypothetical protein